MAEDSAKSIANYIKRAKACQAKKRRIGFGFFVNFA